MKRKFKNLIGLTVLIATLTGKSYAMLPEHAPLEPSPISRASGSSAPSSVPSHIFESVFPENLVVSDDITQKAQNLELGTRDRDCYIALARWEADYINPDNPQQRMRALQWRKALSDKFYKELTLESNNTSKQYERGFVRTALCLLWGCRKDKLYQHMDIDQLRVNLAPTLLQEIKNIVQNKLRVDILHTESGAVETRPFMKYLRTQIVFLWGVDDQGSHFYWSQQNEYRKALRPLLWSLFTNREIYLPLEHLEVPSSLKFSAAHINSWNDIVHSMVRTHITLLYDNFLSKDPTDRVALSIFKKINANRFQKDPAEKIDLSEVAPEDFGRFFRAYLWGAYVSSNQPVHLRDSHLNAILSLAQEERRLREALNELSAIDESAPNSPDSTHESNGDDQRLPSLVQIVVGGSVLEDIMLRRRIAMAAIGLELPEEPSSHQEPSSLNLPRREIDRISQYFTQEFAYDGCDEAPQEFRNERVFSHRRATDAVAQAQILNSYPLPSSATVDAFLGRVRAWGEIINSPDFPLLLEVDQARTFRKYAKFLIQHTCVDRHQEQTFLEDAQRYAEMAATINSDPADSDLRKHIDNRIQTTTH